ncbi:hybrid sensor histidine kinase/response regulator [Deinococcus sp. ME38]|uniref:hybrid sensor histidine kinase/response regulator n=1 Tax=Deinococcus sp. ME38 TaxID=3400344 RepID=UPI003B5B5428
MNRRDATPGLAFRADRDLSGALRGEWLALRADLRAGGEAAARALHSLRAAAAVENDPALADAADRAERQLAEGAGGDWEALLRELGLLESARPQPGAPLPPATPEPSPETPRPAAPGPAGFGAPDDDAAFVSMDVRKLDALLALAGELTGARLQLQERLAQARASQDAGAWRSVQASQHALKTLTDDLAREVLAARLQLARPFLLGFERALRDAARQAGKRARLVVGASAVELDRHTMERLRAPLLHLIRNAADHGLEDPATRAAAGKSPVGTVRLDAYNAGGQVEVTVADDGSGVNFAAVLDSAARRGVTLPDGGALADGGPDLDALTELLFTPGFSSREQVTDLSGRGVGLDVVRTQARQLGGDVTLLSSPQGTAVTLRVPLTLATTRVAVVRCGEQLLAVPVIWVERAGRAGPLLTLEGRRVVRVGDQTVPAAPLLTLLDAAPDAAGEPGTFLLVRQGTQRLALLVDALVGEQEIVIKPLRWPLQGAPHLEGAAILPSGQVVPVLNVRALHLPATRAPAGVPEAAVPAAPRVLLAEDTAVTRQLLAQILQQGGFEVLAVPDGAQALAALRAQPPDLLLTDVEMPELGGLELVRRVRADPRTADLPVVLLTSLGAPGDRAAGAEAGADAYLVKGEFSQEALLHTVRRLL